jgi:hypothetical protein
MANWRDIKKVARGQVHGTFAVPAVYLTHISGTPVRVNVRVHTKVTPNENEFTWPSTSGYVEIVPKIIFDAVEIPEVLGKSLVVLSPTEIYRIAMAEPNREGFLSSDCELLSPADCATMVVAINTSGAAWEGILP